MNQTDYSAPDISTESALRQAGEAQESFVSFTSIRAQSSGAGTLTTGTRATKPASAALNDFYFETDVGFLDYWAGTSWKYMEGMGVGTDATRAAIMVTANDNGAKYFATDTLALWWVTGGAWAKLLEIKGTANQITATIVGGVLTLSLVASPDVTTSYKVAGTKVVGPQGGAVNDVASADATDLASVITLANETKAQLNALLARTRAATGHGLIA